MRSSRKLARECKCNIEVLWLLSKLTPDFRTVSDFRKDNKEAVSKVFKEFNIAIHLRKVGDVAEGRYDLKMREEEVESTC